MVNSASAVKTVEVPSSGTVPCEPQGRTEGPPRTVQHRTEVETALRTSQQVSGPFRCARAHSNGPDGGVPTPPPSDKKKKTVPGDPRRYEVTVATKGFMRGLFEDLSRYYRLEMNDSEEEDEDDWIVKLWDPGRLLEEVLEDMKVCYPPLGPSSNLAP